MMYKDKIHLDKNRFALNSSLNILLPQELKPILRFVSDFFTHSSC